MDFLVASLGDRPSSLITRSTFSTMPNMVRVLMLKPNAARIPKVPSNTTGTVIVVMMVARKFCRNRNITRNTRATASIRVSTTPLIDSLTTGVVS